MQPTLLEQVLSTLGAMLVLGAYLANLAHRIDRDSPGYAGMNLVGSSLLTWVALRSGALGLILIEASWATISLGALIRSVLRRP